MLFPSIQMWSWLEGVKWWAKQTNKTLGISQLLSFFIKRCMYWCHTWLMLTRRNCETNPCSAGKLHWKVGLWLVNFAGFLTTWSSSAMDNLQPLIKLQPFWLRNEVVLPRVKLSKILTWFFSTCWKNGKSPAHIIGNIDFKFLWILVTSKLEKSEILADN